MLLDRPDCVGELLTPCFRENWTQCSKCHRTVCLVHDELIDVRHSGNEPARGYDRLCHGCIEHGWQNGELSLADEYEYINFR